VQLIGNSSVIADSNSDVLSREWVMKKFGMFATGLAAFLCLQQIAYSQYSVRPVSPESLLNEPTSSAVDPPTKSIQPVSFSLRNSAGRFRNSMRNSIGNVSDNMSSLASSTKSRFSAISGTGPSCATGNCAPAPEACDPCCPAFWEHRNSIYGDFLYLTARGANVNFATPVDGILATSRPVGHIAVGDPDYDSGFRVGGNWALDSCSSLEFVFTRWESNTQHSVTSPTAGTFVRADLTIPTLASVANDSLFARANYDLGLQLYDLNYKALIWGGDNHFLNYAIGLRYGHLDQDFVATYSINGATTVDSEIDFNGFGPRFGLDGERLLCNGIFLYGRGFLSVLMGEFDVEYIQANVNNGQQAFTGFNDDRVVPIIEVELGVGWQSECGKYRLSTGYYFTSWFNAMTTQSTITSIQANNFSDIDQTITFDGLTSRFEIRF
jgi:hypothetical protein